MPKKSWDRYRSYGGRRINVREPKQRFLIVCEGEKTEPYYFKGFRVPGDVVVDIHSGAGMHISVVREAITRRDEAQDEYDQVWCVFDRDKNRQNPHDSQQFNDALQLADTNNVRVAYTNDAFELWYFLHFNYHDTAIDRHDYATRLNALVSDGYRKNDPTIFSKLEERMDTALRNAERLLSQYNPVNPERDDPSTTVHLLVTELQQYLN